MVVAVEESNGFTCGSSQAFSKATAAPVVVFFCVECDVEMERGGGRERGKINVVSLCTARLVRGGAAKNGKCM